MRLTVLPQPEDDSPSPVIRHRGKERCHEQADAAAVHAGAEGSPGPAARGGQEAGVGDLRRGAAATQRVLQVGARSARGRAGGVCRSSGAEPGAGVGGQDRGAGGEAGAQGRDLRGGLRGVREAKKNAWGALSGAWVAPDTRDAVVDFVREFSARTEVPVTRVVGWVGIARGKFFDWRQRYGQANEHNALVPRDHWLDEGERQAILDYFDRHPLEGYRRLTFMMLDGDVVAVSPATTYRVLAGAGRLDRWARARSKKGTGFVQPLRPHEHWHIDVSYLNLGGTFYYLCSVLDGCSRAIVHWDLRASMKEQEVECILERAKELY